MPNATVNVDRLKALLAGVNGFGHEATTGGYRRPGFSPADLACRTWFAERMRAEGLKVTRDGAGNLFGRFGPDHGPCVMAGSHLDTVIDGGAYDGALGVCAALECVLALRDAGLTPKTAIEVVATSEEEGRFGGMLGSQAICGQVTPDWIAAAVDADGIRLTEALGSAGLSPAGVLASTRPADDIAAFLELHIEQGPVLEAEGIAVGIAEEISGVCYLELTLTGIANHSGTTPMHLRRDAFAGLAELTAGFGDLVRDHGTDQSRITVGHVELSPNHPHTIPGRAVFSVILRDTSQEVMREMKSGVLERAAAVASRHGLTLASTERSWLSPVALDTGLAERMAGLAERDGIAVRRMPSGAGHDAQTFQSLCPSALIFVASRDGISHAPEEHSDWADIEKGARLMLAALENLSGAG